MNNFEDYWDKQYCYPHSNVLKNKYNITDYDTLSDIERRITSINIAEMDNCPVRGSFDFKHLKNIHKAIFGDLFDWAGKIRTINITKSSVFTLSHVIEPYAENMIFSKLRKDRFLTAVDPHELSQKLTYYFSELNVLHPFREGNGRTQRIFIEYLAKVAGYSVDFDLISEDSMIEISTDSYEKEYASMLDMFDRITEPIPASERIEFCKKIGFPLERFVDLEEFASKDDSDFYLC
ncbi:MAG: Fic family protein [Ruminococcus sp.]|jgi:cell filamentation protein|nr:Fic family protein [Ruminococcus sp.]